MVMMDDKKVRYCAKVCDYSTLTDYLHVTYTSVSI